LELINALSNGAIPDPLLPPLSQDWRFATLTQKPKTPIAIISGTGEAMDFTFGQKHSQGPSEQKPKVKNFGEIGAWAYPGTVQFFGYPNYLMNG